MEWTTTEQVHEALDDGVDVTANNNYAIQWASKTGHLPVVELLVAHGADVTANDNFAIRYASREGHLPVVEFLVAHGADVTAHNNHALLLASAKGHLPVVEFLVAHGADVTADNNLAIHKSSENGHLPVVEFLVAHGADVTSYNNLARRMASHNGHLHVVEFLVAHMADDTEDVVEFLVTREGVGYIREVQRHAKRPLENVVFKPSSFEVIDVCAICLGDVDTPVRTPCGHIFCKVCISDERVTRCPMCREKFSLTNCTTNS